MERKPTPFNRPLSHRVIVNWKRLTNFIKSKPITVVELILALSSVVLGIASIVISIQLSKGEQKIKDLNKIVTELVRANRNQNAQLTELKAIAVRLENLNNTAVNLNLTTLRTIAATDSQTAAIIYNARPTLKLDNYTLVDRQGEFGSYTFKFHLTNTGLREARNITYGILFLTLGDDNKPTGRLVLQKDTAIFRLDAGQGVAQELYFTSSNITLFAKVFIRIDYRYEDPLSGPVTKIVYLKNESTSLFGPLVFSYPKDPRVMKMLDHYRRTNTDYPN